MNEQELISLVVDALRANPRAAVILAAVLALAALVGNVWQLAAKETREAFKLRRPYVGAALEVLASLVPLVVRAARAVKHAGKPRDGSPSSPPSSPGFSEAALMRWIASVALVAAAVRLLVGCSPTLPADLYRGVGVGVAVTAAGGRELALLEARECLGKPSRVEAEACLVPWRARWSAIAQAWQGAASRAQSLAHVVASVDAQLERRFPAMDAGAVGSGGAADAAVNE